MRTVLIHRKTKETDIKVEVNLDGREATAESWKKAKLF